MSSRHIRPLLAGVLALLSARAQLARADLRADELLLVVNGNSKASVSLAQAYAKLRGVPDGRIVKLDLWGGEAGQDEISFELYEKDVVPPIRRFIRDNKLEGKVRCLVTFYGTPIRISPVKLSLEAKAEVTDIRRQLEDTLAEIEKVVVDLEGSATSVVPDFHPGTGSNLEQLNARSARAAQALAVASRSNAVTRPGLVASVYETLGKLTGDAGLLQRFPAHPADAVWAAREERVAKARAELADLGLNRYDAEVRKRWREVVRSTFGLIDYAELLRGQDGYFSTDQSVASFDSELSLLNVDWYSRERWVRNVLHYETPPLNVPQVMMVSRLDAPTDGMVLAMMETSARVEREGLRGKVVLDARGPGIGQAYEVYDQTISRLGALLRAKTQLDVALDEKPELFPPHSQAGVAVYCGWYSVGHYVPSCNFVPGAVGFHVASYEMASIHDPKNTGWVRGLVKDGVVGTLGPVSEPYLFAFPDADEFFPLLMTGKVTLAEAFWKTERVASWQVGLVGDPLYRPFAANPPLAVQDLPARLRAAATGQATGRPSR